MAMKSRQLFRIHTVRAEMNGLAYTFHVHRSSENSPRLWWQSPMSDYSVKSSRSNETDE